MTYFSDQTLAGSNQREPYNRRRNGRAGQKHGRPNQRCSPDQREELTYSWGNEAPFRISRQSESGKDRTDREHFGDGANKHHQ